MQYRPKLDEMERRFEELTAQMADPAVINDSTQYRKVTKEQSDLSELVGKYRDWKTAHQNLEEARVMLTDADQDLREMARDEVTRLEPQLAQIEQDIKIMLLPKDPNDDKNIVLEIRAGTGGDEATLFANEVFRMYSRFAETRHWKVEVTSASDSAVGGIKEVIALVSGDKVYSQLKYESGVHRVQRVPATEQQGRVHTSAITVAVLPEVDDVEIKLEPKDVRIDTFCSSGPGGQSVNTTYSAVRLTHLPTGTVVSCQDEKSQIKNRAKAERVLRSRLYEIELQKQQDKLGAERRSMVGSGDRSEKIRTYNFPQNRLTDHRIGLTLHQLNLVMEGRLEPIIDALTVYYQNEGLKDSGEPQGGPPIIPREPPNRPTAGPAAP
jgi:peptide chain release factor 1